MAGWKGEECEVRTCPNDCGGPSKGTCNSAFQCECAAGYTGFDCSSLSCPLDCSGHGTCFNGTCYCAPGFRGVGCNEPTCFNDCSGNGLCSQGVCKCYPGWAGTDCAIKVCPGAVGGVHAGSHYCESGDDGTAYAFAEAVMDCMSRSPSTKRHQDKPESLRDHDPYGTSLE